MTNNFFIWLVIIKKEFLKKQVLNQAVFYGTWLKYFLPLTFLLSRILSRKGFNNSRNIFELS